MNKLNFSTSNSLNQAFQIRFFLNLVKGLFIVVLLMSCLDTHAQDRIIRKDGEEIKAKILSTDNTYIRYKRFDNLNGPEYFIYRSDVEKFEYEGGSKPPTVISTPGPNISEATLAMLEQNALKYKRKQLLFSTLGAGAVVAGVATYFSVQGNYSDYKNQLEQTNREFTSWYTQNYNRAPNASDLAEPKSLTSFGTPGIYLAAAGIVGGVVFELLGLRNGILRRKTLREIEQIKKNAVSFQPFYNHTTRTGGVGLALRF